MNGYKPFPIYDFRSGLQLDREPWLIPANAFQEADNVYFYNGRIYKRKGYEPFGQSANGGESVLTTPPVMGLYNYFTTGGASYLLAFDKDYLYQYDPVNDDWVGKGGHGTLTPDWTGGDNNFFWCEVIPKGQLGAVSDFLLILNNVDAIKTWNGSALASLSGGNTPDTALLAVLHKNRIIYLNTQESGTRYPQRARCSNVGTYSNFSENVYCDADTVDWIMGVAFVRGELMVFFERSVWWLRYTGDAKIPFVFKQIDETEGCYASFSTVNFENEAIALGPTSWIGCDGLRVYGIDEKIPDLILSMNQEKLEYAYGFLAEELRQYLCSFPSIGQSYPDKILVLNYGDNAFSIYNLPIHVTGYWTQAADWTFDDITVTMDEMTWAFDEKTLTAGYPITIMGDRSGKTWKMFTTDDDNGSNISVSLKSKRLIPYEGHKAKLGYLDIIGDSGSNLSFTLKFYKDYKSVPYLTRTVTMYEAGKDKTRQRIRVMEKGERHIIEIVDNSKNNPWVIDGLVPWFKQAGPL